MNKKEDTMESLVALCKRRGFIFPGSDIYGGLAGTWDYGPLGVMLEGLLPRLRIDEILYLHLLEFARAEEEIAGGDLIPERLADLRHAERKLGVLSIEDILEIHEHALRGLRTKV